ncbi:uncharacterized protein [Salvelinus sp. IW2-2015]|uniref:uncharacterized protein n=1 Tax=Salvelinus sp. IW2-2015 TaxID=2691554 RepID=UPI0038D4F813
MTVYKGKPSSDVHYPFDPMQPGPIYFLTLRNCSGQNKKKFVLWYCAWRTMHKLHHSLDLHFLITGHTKFAPDWCFGLIEQRFRKARVNTLSEIAGVVKDSTVTGVSIPQLVGLEDGKVLVESYGWQQHLTPYFRPLPQFKQYQHFSFDALEPGVVVAKERSDSVGTRFQLQRNADILLPSSATKRLWTSHALHQNTLRMSAELGQGAPAVRTEEIRELGFHVFAPEDPCASGRLGLFSFEELS